MTESRNRRNGDDQNPFGAGRFRFGANVPDVIRAANSALRARFPSLFGLAADSSLTTFVAPTG